jgi:pimeloyl-ACP methyl ester carboxylesterase
VALTDALGHQRFAVAGHDTGMWIGYALAADHPDRVDRLVVAEAAMPGVSPSPPLFGSAPANDRLWHFAFNRRSGRNQWQNHSRQRHRANFSGRPPTCRLPLN